MSERSAEQSAAFELGADAVEIDLHPTTDGHFAVFHDWTVDCTEGSGETRQHSLAELQALDIGYGYTAEAALRFRSVARPREPCRRSSRCSIVSPTSS